jgi:hypothetical protein
MAAIEIRPRSRMRIVSAKPMVDLADALAVGNADAVERELRRIARAATELAQVLGRREPRRPALDDERGDPACFDSDAAFVRASTTQKPPTEPWVMNVFVPLRTQSFPSRLAVVLSAAESLPLPGSVSAQAASHSPLAAFGR